MMTGTAAFAQSADISNTGSDSNNTINQTSNCTVKVKQKNTTNVEVIAEVISNTGGNEVSNNTNTAVNLTTGNADANLTVSVDGGENNATVPDCCACNQGDANSTINTTGSGSNNTINQSKSAKTKVKQKNRTNVGVLASIKSKSGKNKIKKNTGGSVDVTTGDAASNLDVTVTTPSNNVEPAP